VARRGKSAGTRLCAAAGLLFAASATWGGERSDAELTHLVRHDCGSCHGLRLTGGLGPALTPELLADKPVAWLSAVILQGVPGTAMPGWRGVVTEAEAERIATYLKEQIHENP
jgi:cytochrome c55X